ncbi:MAG: BREX-1 system phosphatase PglZ type A, partial [Methyloprofundus sp.]|nr:BREX-1 system phosphatase PglZ type A [Methyloprofundus sp.]
MDIPQIKQTLSRLFFEDNNRLIFWHDPDAEFVDSIPELDDVVLIRMDQEPALGIKIRIEREQADQRFLMYSPTLQPEAKTDWFLDCRYFSYTFKADRPSIILDDLGLKQQQLHDYIVHHKKFFAHKGRLKQLQQWVIPDDGEKELSQKMMAVTVKADQPEFNHLLLALFQQLAEQTDLNDTPPVWDDLGKYDLHESFWSLIHEHFGYMEESPNLRNFLIRLFVTDFSYHLQYELPTVFKHLVLPTQYNASASVFLGQWRDSSRRNGSYDVLSTQVADLLKLTDCLHELDEASLTGVMSFLDVEKQLCRLLRDHILDTSALLQPDTLLGIIRTRLDGYWCAKHLPSNQYVPRLALHHVYQALSVAIAFFSTLNQSIEWQQKTPELQYKQYCDLHYQFDQNYRLFSEFADHARSEGWDILKDLRDKIEATYNEQVLLPLSLAWDTHLSSGLLNSWLISGSTNQQDFFHSAVKPLLDKADNRKVYVIISDAFRYEVAQELSDQLNGQFRFQATLDSLLG